MEPVETVDRRDLVAHVLAHIPDPRRHLVHSYGAYSNLARGKAKGQRPGRQGAAPRARTGRGAVATLPGSGRPAPSMGPAHPKALPGRDLLLCPRCQGVMRVFSFITQPRLIRRILEHLAGRATQQRAPPAALGDVCQDSLSRAGKAPGEGGSAIGLVSAGVDEIRYDLDTTGASSSRDGTDN